MTKKQHALIHGHIDFISDVHGQFEFLEKLLVSMDYRCVNGVYQHPTRIAIFLGDYIDVGPRQLDVLFLIRAMVENEHAIAAMGNHELNAIGWWTHVNGLPLRNHSEKNRQQHDAFLSAVVDGSALHKEWIDWFKTLPVFIEHPLFVAAHACMCEDVLSRMKLFLDPLNRLIESNIHDYFNEEHESFTLIEWVLKGPEVKLPEEIDFVDHAGNKRVNSRFAWWVDPSAPKENALLVPKSLIEPGVEAIRAMNVWPFVKIPERPCFFGHYWMKGDVDLISPTLVCLDYSVARGDKLAAYRFNGETELRRESLLSVSID